MGKHIRGNRTFTLRVEGKVWVKVSEEVREVGGTREESRNDYDKAYGP